MASASALSPPVDPKDGYHGGMKPRAPTNQRGFGYANWVPIQTSTKK